VVVTVLGRGRTVVLAADPSEVAADFKRRVLAEALGLPASSPSKLVYAGKGSQVAGLKTLRDHGVGHRTGLQLDLPKDLDLPGGLEVTGRPGVGSPGVENEGGQEGEGVSLARPRGGTAPHADPFAAFSNFEPAGDPFEQV
jgi:hypothetical protein